MQATATVSDFTLTSTWTCASGAITAGPSKDMATKTFSISGIPSGAVIEKAEVSAVFSSTLTGWPRVLTMNLVPVNDGSESTVAVDPLSSGNGDYAIIFEFRARGNANLSDGNHIDRCMISDATLTVTYSSEEPEPPVPEPEADWGPEGRPVSVFPGDAEQCNTNGLAVLTPISGDVKMVAGGTCELNMRLPIDDLDKWQHVIPEAIVRAPVPTERIENAFVGIDVDLYVTNTAAALREGPSEPASISYPPWNPDNNYVVGDKVTYTYANKNYQCIFFDETSPYKNIGPSNSPWWKEIPRNTPGSPVLVQLAKGAELYFLEDAGGGWYKMSTPMGLEGYIKASQLTFVRHITPEEQDERIIRDQLFRVKTVTADTRNMEANVYARHVSYDLSNILIRDVTLNQASPAMAITRVVNGLLTPYKGQIATNLTTDENGTYTGSPNGKNGVFAFLDPDNGIVPAFNARFTRDNWDLFVLKKQHTDRGFRLRYGNNLKGITWKRDSQPLVLRVVPVAKDESGADFYLPETFVDSEHLAEYKGGEPPMERLAVKGQIGKDDGSGTGTNWTAETLCDEMRAKAMERFTVDHADEVYQEITVDFEQLGDTVEYSWLKGLETVLLYDLVKCTDERIGLAVDMTVTELTWDIVRKKVKALKLSTSINYGLTTVAGYNIGNNSITAEKLTEAAVLEIANLLT